MIKGLFRDVRRLPLFHSKQSLGAFICAVVSLLVLAVSEMGYSELKHSFTAVEVNDKQKANLQQLLTLLVDAETGSRGYLLTGDAKYLDPYRKAMESIPTLLDSLRDNYHADPHMVKVISALGRNVNAKITEMDITVRLRRDGMIDATRAVVESDIGRQRMEQIRKTVADLSELQRSEDTGTRNQWLRQALWVRLGVAVTTALSLLTFFYYAQYYGRMAAEKEHEAKLIELERAKLESEVERRTADLTELAIHLQRVREDERAKLARELHDELGALLTAAKLDLTALRMELKQAPPSSQERIRQLADTLTEGIQLKRRIIEDLRPSILNHLGLVAALQNLADDFAERSGLDVDTRLDPAVRVDPQAGIALYRIVQEALTNVEKYSKARHIHIELDARPTDTVLRVHDDGVGFDPASVARSGAHGLAGMRHRALALRGHLSIRSRPGRGTLVEVVLPATEAEAGPAGNPPASWGAAPPGEPAAEAARPQQPALLG